MMNTPYKVRLKTKTKIRIALLFTAFTALISFLTWELVDSQLFKRTDDFEWRSHRLKAPEKCWTESRFRVYVCSFNMRINRFEILQTHSFKMVDGKYCIAKVYKNNRFQHYAVTSTNDCV